MENIRRVAFDLKRERDQCEHCAGTMREGRGRRRESTAPEGIPPSSPCKTCLGRGYLWYEKRPSLSIPRPLNLGITDERLRELWEQRRKSN